MNASPQHGRRSFERLQRLRRPLVLVRIPEIDKGALVSQNANYSQDDAVLVLEDGQVYVGEPYGALGRTTGEIVFATGMTGYQETLTDPSYDRQIVVQTFPHIGDTGINQEDPESARIWVAGYVVRDPSPNVSNWRATGSLDDDLVAQGIVGISHIDTRKLVRHLRSAGVMRAGIYSGEALLDESGAPKTIDALLADVKTTPQMQGLSLYDEVSTNETYTIEPAGEFEGKEPLFTVAAVDLGIKAMTPHRMAERGCRVHVVPSTITFDELEELHPDGVFFSNGPGDPEQADPEVELLRRVLDAGYPFFGICFGNQLLGRALGFGTYKLKFGHRGINQPVKDVTTGKVEVTAHNHGFAVDAPIGDPVPAPHEHGKYGKVFVSHIDLNDDVVEGLQCVDIPAFSVQYHPEAAAGPHDAAYLFDRFVDLMKSNKEGK
ncbi:glutamine-hydrolyzing carbamoyl-phosphate synthase small subunit [Bifidobacterium lemurum]|nr:glutamine-hydrolyzing carbamoyl-phosphate synthase small subunit [Bifidobacterium lemurum]